MRTSTVSRFVKGMLVISAIAVAPILSASTSFAQEMPPSASDAVENAPASTVPARPSSVQITPIEAEPGVMPRESGDPFNFAPAAQMPTQALGSPSCEASMSCPIMWRLGAGWAIDTGGPGIHLERVGDDD